MDNAQDQYLVEAENGFIGMQSRQNPLALQPGYVQLSQNMRMDRGIASTRSGLKRLTTPAMVSATVFGSGVYSVANGTEYIVLATGTGIFVYNTATLTVGSLIAYPTGRTIVAADVVTLVQANNVMYIYRGQAATPISCTITRVSTIATVTASAHGFSNGDEVVISGATQTDYNNSFVISNVTANTFDYTVGAGAPATPATGTILCSKGKSTLVWDGATTITVVPQGITTGASANMPCSDFAIFFKSRLILKVDRDKIAASDYLDFNTWDSTFAQFTINLGANDSIVGFQPWQEDKFIIFQRNSIYYAYVDPSSYVTGSPPGATSYIQSLTSEFGCVARRSIVNAGEYVFFLSDHGVYLLNPSLDLKLLGNTTPLSDPISDYIARINVEYSHNAVGRIYNNRYYLAVPLDNSTRNNAVLIYSMLNKAWEAIDTFPSTMYVDNFIVSIYGKQKRLYAINKENGIFLTEENNYDEFDNLVGNPLLPFYLPQQINNNFLQYPIAGVILTRRYFYDTFQNKRYSSAEVDISSTTTDVMRIDAVTSNPDNDSEVFSFSTSTAANFTKRFPIAKKGFGLDLRFTVTAGRPAVRGLRLNATVPGRTLVSAE